MNYWIFSIAAAGIGAFVGYYVGLVVGSGLTERPAPVPQQPRDGMEQMFSAMKSRAVLSVIQAMDGVTVFVEPIGFDADLQEVEHHGPGEAGLELAIALDKARGAK